LEETKAGGKGEAGEKEEKGKKAKKKKEEEVALEEKKTRLANGVASGSREGFRVKKTLGVEGMKGIRLRKRNRLAKPKKGERKTFGFGTVS